MSPRARTVSIQSLWRLLCVGGVGGGGGEGGGLGAGGETEV